MGLLDIYPEGQSRAEASKILLQQFLMVDHLLSIARILHDTLKYHLINTPFLLIIQNWNLCFFFSPLSLF